MDFVRVKTSGTIDRDDKCNECHQPMLYRVDGNVISEIFCGNIQSCYSALKNILSED